MVVCKECKENPKRWSGADRVCGFSIADSSTLFTTQNWMCALLGQLRDLVHDINGSSHEGRIFTFWENDQNQALIQVQQVVLSQRAEALWMTWYKSRGRTEKIVMLADDKIWIPIESDIRRIVKHYQQEVENATI